MITKDALGSFEQPAALLPFRVSEDAAKDIIRERLRGLSERLAGLLRDNRVARAAIEGVYLPFWLFDGVVEVTRTTVEITPSGERQRDINPYQHERFQDGVLDVAVCAMQSSPPSALTARLGNYDLSGLVNYAPRLLARHPAALYDLDFDAASLQARGLIAERMRERYSENASRRHQEHVYSMVQQMSFRLVLLPVWLVTLYERDGDVRPALINGQTGEAVLGRAEQ
ncbi:MAG: hypothetical protein GYB67_19500 [Chloroflexi bacterium]|nr:hypothetical protein [Chloroflexota bacterium]